MAAPTALTSLAQPVLADGIALTITPSSGQQVAGLMASYLAQAQAITRRDFPLAANDPLTACSTVLSHWLHRHIGDTTCLEPLFQLEPSLVDNIHDFDEAASHVGASDAPAVRGVHIRWTERDICQWSVGPGFDTLEAMVPGLGATVLDILERKSGQAYPLFTPSLVLDEASSQYWMGEADETEYLESACGDDREAYVTLRAEMVTRAAIAEAFPPWALELKTAVLPQRVVRAIAIRHTDGFVRRAAALALALAGTRTVGDYSPRREGLFTGFGAVLCWRDNDIAVRVSDDYAQYAWQGDYFNEIGEVILPIADPDALRRWMRAITPNLRAIGLIDRLLAHLSARY
ncbi:MAG: PRTRC system protein F [Burkholderiaceae bacterium]|nr:PRTRC system protein F [Burkholderiaceae bacterium]